IHTSSAVRYTPCTRRTFGCRSALRIAYSRSSAAIALACRVHLGDSTLSATSSFATRSRASHTSPLPPQPRRRTSANLADNCRPPALHHAVRSDEVRVRRFPAARRRLRCRLGLRGRLHWKTRFVLVEFLQ